MAMVKKDPTGNRVQGRPLTIGEACTLLGVSVATLYRYMANGDLPFHKNGGTRVIDETDVLECKDNRTFRRVADIERMQRRAAAHALHALYDGRAITKPAREAFLGRFEHVVDPDRVLPPLERKRRAEQAKKAYFIDLARRSSKSRGRRRGRS